MRRAVSIIRTVTYVEVVIAEGEDEDEVTDAAIDKVRNLKTDGSTFKLLGHEDHVGQVLNVVV